MILDSVTFRAYPSEERVERFSLLAEEFISHSVLVASRWESLLGMMSSLLQLVGGSRLHLRPLQFSLRSVAEQAPEVCRVDDPIARTGCCPLVVGDRPTS